MISSWVLKTSHSETFVKGYLAKRRTIIEGRVDGDPDWGLMFDQLVQFYHTDDISMGGTIVKAFNAVQTLKEKR